jgi:hypothetical protein
MNFAACGFVSWVLATQAGEPLVPIIRSPVPKTIDIRVRVVDRHYKNLEGAEVQLIDGNGTLLKQSTTNESGLATFQDFDRNRARDASVRASKGSLVPRREDLRLETTVRLVPPDFSSLEQLPSDTADQRPATVERVTARTTAPSSSCSVWRPSFTERVAVSQPSDARVVSEPYSSTERAVAISSSPVRSVCPCAVPEPVAASQLIDTRAISGTSFAGERVVVGTATSPYLYSLSRPAIFEPVTTWQPYSTRTIIGTPGFEMYPPARSGSYTTSYWALPPASSCTCVSAP